MRQKILFFITFSLLLNVIYGQVHPITEVPTQMPVTIDWQKIKARAIKAPMEAMGELGNLIQLPGIKGEIEDYYVLESPIMADDFAEAYPDIRTYILNHDTHTGLTGRMMVTADYIHVILLDGRNIIQIRPDDLTNPSSYSIGTFDESPPPGIDEAYCGQTEDENVRRQIRNNTLPQLGSRATGFSNSTRRTYNLAVVTTGEFHDANGGTVAAATATVVTSVNAIQAIYDRELSVRFNLLTPVIYTDHTTDPFDTLTTKSRPNLAANGVGLNFSPGSYDIGHVFHNSSITNEFSGGGVAGLGVVCNNNATGFGTGLYKAWGWSGSFNNTSNGWYRLASHEFGHMYGANHTFNGDGSNSCNNNISSSNGFEIGSGTTIMSYRGLCGAGQNVPSSGADDNYFHAHSLEEMFNYITTSGACATNTATGNTAPVATAGPSYTIPAETPFILTGTASDVDGDMMTYSWEQVDEDGPGTPTQGLTGAAAAADPDAPLFRTFPPSAVPYRIFPELSNILDGNNTGLDFEALPAANRTMNFAFTVRDNNPAGGGIQCDATTVTVDATTGPFVVTSQNAPIIWTANGTNTATINWDVAGTTGGSVNATTVDILFSDDDGQTFPYTLASATPNDGTHTITIPNYPTYTGRIKIQGTNNIFFDINNAEITISSTCAANGATFSPDAPVTAVAGDPALDLSLTPDYGAQISSMVGVLESTDPPSNLALDNGSGCSFYSNPVVYDTYLFQVNAADTYTFTRTTGSNNAVLNLYQGPFVGPCTNWITSSGLFNGSLTLNNSLSAALVPGVEYTLVVSSFNATNPTLPSAYTVTPSSAGSGLVFDGSPDPGAGFSYTYVMTDNGSGNIVSIDPGADLSNSLNFPAGAYTVQGLSYLSTENLTPYIGGAFSTLENDLIFLAICGNLSNNDLPVTVDPNPFPIEYLSFEAKATDNYAVQLNWATAIELNNDYFEIERRGEGEEFISIGKVSGAGTTDRPTEYAFFDTSPHQQNLWYRLRQVDFDGKFSYSDVREVNLKKLQENWLLYPNPGRDYVSIVPPAHLSQENHRISLYDLQGRLLMEKSTEGQKSVELEIEHLPNAMYMVRIESSAENTHFLKLRKD